MAHYSLAQRPKQLLQWAEKIALDIYLKDIKEPVLVYTGMSGISSATAISLQLHVIGVEHGMVYIRKENEESHGDDIEYEGIGLTDRYGGLTSVKGTIIFVDDFISSGNTKRRVMKKLSKFTNKTEPDYTAVQQIVSEGYNYKLIKEYDND